MISAVRTCPLLVPLMVKEYVPGATLFLVSTIKVVVPEAVTEVGVNLAVTNFGSPLTEKVTMPVNPVPGAIDTA